LTGPTLNDFPLLDETFILESLEFVEKKTQEMLEEHSWACVIPSHLSFSSSLAG
jgi:hypothetical protein